MVVGIPFLRGPALGLPGLHRRDPLSTWSLALAERACRHRKGQNTYQPAIEYYQWKYEKLLQRNAVMRVCTSKIHLLESSMPRTGRGGRAPGPPTHQPCRARRP
jgi:hypothetical protein